MSIDTNTIKVDRNSCVVWLDVCMGEGKGRATRSFVPHLFIVSRIRRSDTGDCDVIFMTVVILMCARYS